MTSVVQRLIQTIFPPHQFKVSIGGLDGAGKTALLYRLYFGEFWPNTIPTLGWNVETFKAPSSSVGGVSNVEITAWDGGAGCSRNYTSQLLVQIAADCDAMIWVVDGTSDKEMLGESRMMLAKFMNEVDLRRGTEGKTQTQPLLILATRKDQKGGLGIDFLRQAVFFGWDRSRPALILECELNTSIEKTNLPAAFDWLTIVTKTGKPPPAAMSEPKKVEAPAKLPAPSGSDAVNYEKLNTWLKRAVEDPTTPQDFIAQFHAVNLPEWDHYTHIRIAYLLLLFHGRQQGKNMIFDGLQTYIMQSPQARGRTFHFTMTYFWIQVVHFGMRSMAHLTQAQDSDAGPGPKDEFAKFLLVNPHVIDGSFWTNCYTKEVLMSQKAKEEMVLPDKKPLPSLVIRDKLQGLS